MNTTSQTKPVIGVVGGVGAGKTAAAAELAALGCTLIDADAIGHALLGDEQVKSEIRSRFGEGVFDAEGNVSRPALAAVVFGDAAKLAALNAILHQRIRSEIAARIAAAQQDTSIPAVVVDAAMLFEAGWNELCTHAIFVNAADDLRARRTEAGKGWGRDKWRQVEKTQISLDKKAEKCDYTIDNSSSASYLREQIHQILSQILHAGDNT
ncbi:MAG: dephospho-CoA kinase [Phycisphaerae bacterium]|nr:dephospho-CoA kinase [Phycisphaerae bacterium]